MPAALLGQPKPTAPQTNEADLDYAAAFFILIGKDGTYTFDPDINKPITVERPPTSSEVKGSLSSVLSDIEAQETAMIMLAIQEQRVRQVMESQMNQHVLSQIGRNK